MCSRGFSCVLACVEMNVLRDGERVKVFTQTAGFYHDD